MKTFNFFKKSDLEWLIIGETVSVLGDWASYVVIPIILYDLTNDPISVGVLMICRFLPSILLPFLINQIISKFNVLKIMIFCDFLRSVSTMGFIFATEPLQFYMLTIINYIGTAIFNPGKYSLVSLIVDKHQLSEANSYIGSINKLFMLVGPIFGGVVYNYIGKEGALIFNSVTFIFSMFALSKITIESSKIDIRKGKEKDQKQTRDLVFKFSLFKDVIYKKRLGNLIFSDALGSLAFGSLNVLFPIVSKDIFRSPDIVYGYIMSFLGGGLLIGNIISPFLNKYISNYLIYAVATLSAALSLILFGLSEYLILSLMAIFLVGVGNGLQENSILTFIQEHSEKEKTMNTLSLSQALTSFFIIISMTFSALMVAKIGLTLTILSLGLIPFFISVFLLFTEFIGGFN